MKLRYSVSLLLLFSLSTGWLGRATFVHTFCVTGLLVYVIAPLFLGSLVYACYAANRENWGSLIPSAWVAGAAAALLLSLVTGDWLLKSDLSEAKAFLGKAIPVIQSYRFDRGRVPSNLAEIPGLPDIPRLLQWRENNGRYDFWIRNQSAIIGDWSYDESTDTWIYAND